jgi:hypothetical protein
MGGIDIELLRKTTITLPTIAASGTLYLPPLAEFIDTLGWVSGALVVRLWSETLPALAKVKVRVREMMVGADDPAQTFVGATLAEVEITDSLNPPAMLQARVPNPASASLVIGRCVGAYLYLEAGANGLSGEVTLAANLVGRDA